MRGAFEVGVKHFELSKFGITALPLYFNYASPGVLALDIDILFKCL